VSRPQLVEALVGHKITQIASGTSHCLALTDEGTIYVWGKGEYGRLGIGQSRGIREPMQLPSLGNMIIKIAAGPNFSAAITSKNSLYMWGRDDGGQLGVGPSWSMDVTKMESSPRHVQLEQQRIVDVALGTRNTVLLTDAGSVYQSGLKKYIQPTLLSSVHGDLVRYRMVAAGAGNGYTALVDDDGFLWTWGKARSGCLGEPGFGNTRSPSTVSPFGDAAKKARVVAVFCGSHQIAVFTY